ncbi:MAG TPA: alpha/beta hydrolase [Solirubrobacteraceae bacterium]|nr:alpha/beta hydrolase [Solirubrobacteraceae bacterium]
MFLHPGPGVDGSVFLPGAERLAATHRVLIVDLPGNGRSADGDRGEWTLAGFARAVDGLAGELGLTGWTLLGHSFGGYVAMQHLVDFPGSAVRVVASCTDAEEEPPPDAPADPFADLPEDVAARIREAFDREATVATAADCREVWTAQMPFFAGSPDAVPALREAFADVEYRPEVHHPRDWGDLHALEALAAADIPVLAIAAELDRPTPPACARRIAETAPRGELLMIEGAGHFPFVETPDAYWDGLAAWLARTEAA